MAPLALLAGLVLIVVSDHLAARISAAVFTITAVLLFGVSAIYHRGTWSPRGTEVGRVIDPTGFVFLSAVPQKESGNRGTLCRRHRRASWPDS